jgi:TgpA N-terminal domain/Transglutaminase-like superfamily
MTTTAVPTAGPEAPSAPSRPAGRDASATHRTLMTLLAVGLGILPLKALLSDLGWVFEAWLTMAVVILPAALIRLRRAPSALDIWPGIVLLVPWLTQIFVSKHAWGGFIPTGATWTDISHLMDSLHRTTRDEAAPIHSTVAVRLVLCALLGLMAALIDLIAVVGRRGALAGVPLLVVYTISGAVPRNPVAWGWFAIAAVGFLILLGIDANDELREWGRRISRRGGSRTPPGLAISAQRIGVIAVLVAVVLPFLVPDHPKNLLADAFHNGNGSGVGGFGAGSGGSGEISPFVALKGQLDRSKAADLATVHVDGSATPPPFYLKTNVLDRYTADVGWSVGNHGASQPLNLTAYETDPPAESPRSNDMRVTVTVKGLTGNAPVFSHPISITGLEDGASWSPQDQILLGHGVHKGIVYVEQVAQPQPTVADLRASDPTQAAGMSRWLALPNLPKYVTDLVAQLTGNKNNAYDKARAISDYFALPANGFVYSLKTKTGDSGSALVDFLKNKTGFCQQYAAAMGVMLRAAGIPSRVVLGYMHPPLDRDHNFTVSTLDAHAWVEGYFPGVGWVPFDPTPPGGLSGGKSGDLPWAPHVFTSAGSDSRPRETSSAHQPAGPNGAGSTSTAAAPVGSGGGSHTGLVWFGLGVLILALILLVPAAVRDGRRRRRYAAARRGDPDALWAELSDTAVDLGYVWSPARSPRQVSAWLARDAGGTAPALDALATAVERGRYAPPATATVSAGLVRDLHEVSGQLKSRRSRRLRFRARFWPASLGWGRRLGSLTAVAHRRR